MAYSRGRNRQHWSHDEEIEEGVLELIEDIAESQGCDVAVIDNRVHITDPSSGKSLTVTVTASPITPEATTRFIHNQQRRRGSH